METPLALYRRYRPETFAEVIGQDHVTGPLRAALAGNRVNHAYLFSGPRGCGKTTSARILARTLNCEQAPVADPCGKCRSCLDLARGGPGSLDVIEIDAASHGGVDDARDLREKAFFAPVNSRYKVYVIDEAHMVTTAGFNALLKLVEEPPEHLRFIFATTEPDKVLPTIRSRTHHYPFRLIPPRTLTTYLGELCEKEGVSIEPAALPMVVRAGAGSARDTLSVLDQLMGGAGPEGITYQLAVGLLGYTPDTLLDEAIDAFAARDGGSVFGVVDKVIETGQDPRRFAEDLLRRLRDLVIIAAVPDAASTGLLEVAPDQGERMAAQAARFGAAEMSRAADLVATGLTEMRGATAPRLLLELICARVLLPGADHSTDGVLARLDRLERNANIMSPPPVAQTTPRQPSRAPARPAEPAPQADPRPVASTPVEPSPVEPSLVQPSPFEPGPAEPSPFEPGPIEPGPIEPGPIQPGPIQPGPGPTPSPAVPPAAPEAVPASTEAPEQPSAPAAQGGGMSLVDVRRIWPDIVEASKGKRRLAWVHLTQNSQVVGVEGNLLTLGFKNAGARESFLGSGCDEVVSGIANELFGVSWRVEAIVAPGAEPTGDNYSPSAPAAAPPAAQATGFAPVATAPAVSEGAPPDWAVGETQGPAGTSTQAVAPPASQASGNLAVASTVAEQQALSAQEGDLDDPDLDEDGMDSTELLKRTLGAEVIDEIPNG